MFIDDKKEKVWRCNNRCVKSYFTLIDQQQLDKMKERESDLATNAGKQKFLKQSTFRFTDPEEVKKEHQTQSEHEL